MFIIDENQNFQFYFFAASKPLTEREAESIKQAAREKRKASSFRTAPDGRLIIDIDDEDKTDRHQEDEDDEEEEEMRREDLKDLMETLSLGQLARGKRKRPTELDDFDDEDDLQYEDTKTLRSNYRRKLSPLSKKKRLSEAHVDMFLCSWRWRNSP